MFILTLKVNYNIVMTKSNVCNVLQKKKLNYNIVKIKSIKVYTYKPNVKIFFYLEGR